ncbi:MAG: glycosyltransferase [Symbiobacteriia bacterium]
MEIPIKRPLQMDYLRKLTDDTGIFQHSKFGVPDRSKGYTSDDNARALIAAVMLYRRNRHAGSLDLMYTYLSFLQHAQNRDGSFRNLLDYDRRFPEEKGSEDCLGRCVWALGFALSESSVPENLKNSCRYMLNEALPHITVLRSPRAQAYAVIGLSYLLETPDSLTYSFPHPHAEEEGAMASFLPRGAIESLVAELGSRLRMQYLQNKGQGWHWFEDSITYSNAVLPWSLLKVSQLSGSADMKETAKESLDFLTSVTFSGDGYFKPIGCHGWLPRNGEAALFDEQPIEACETLLAYLEAFKVLGDETYLKQATLCYEWFLGRNSQHLSLLDPQTGACYDGLHAGGLNLNQGAESIISYSIAQLAMNHE